MGARLAAAPVIPRRLLVPATTTKSPTIIDPETGDGRLTDHLSDATRRVLIVFWHGVGDVVNFVAPLARLRELYPRIHFDLGLANGLDEETIFPEAVLLDGDWRSQIESMDYDLVFICHFPVEDIRRPTMTKAELCCEKELGIEPVAGEPRIIAKKLVGVHFQATALPWVANADEATAQRIWNDIIEAGCVPFETHFEHVFHNPVNERYPFIDKHVRNWPPRLENLIALLGACHAFVGVVSGNFHLAHAILGPDRVMFLENESRATQFTKQNVATANLKQYNGEVKRWLEQMS
jgi:hypothetical protein